MKLLKTGTLKKSAILGAGLLLIVGFQNCSQTQLKSPKADALGLASDSNGGSGTPTVTPGPNGTTIDSSAADPKPASINYSENLMISMQNQLGIATPSAKTLAAVNAGKGQLSAKGPFNNVDTVNQPMWGAITAISGEFCVDAINADKAKAIGTAAAPGTRSFFNLVNFTVAPSNFNDTIRTDVIRRLSLAVWGRPETADESTQIKTALDAMLALPPVTGTSAAVQSENAALFICTAMLASLDSIRN